MDVDDGKSSSSNVGQPPSNPFANDGRASFASMLQSAAADRVASEKAVSDLTYAEVSSILLRYPKRLEHCTAVAVGGRGTVGDRLGRLFLRGPRPAADSRANIQGSSKHQRGVYMWYGRFNFFREVVLQVKYVIPTSLVLVSTLHHRKSTFTYTHYTSWRAPASAIDP